MKLRTLTSLALAGLAALALSVSCPVVANADDLVVGDAIDLVAMPTVAADPEPEVTAEPELPICGPGEELWPTDTGYICGPADEADPTDPVEAPLPAEPQVPAEQPQEPAPAPPAVELVVEAPAEEDPVQRLAETGTTEDLVLLGVVAVLTIGAGAALAILGYRRREAPPLSEEELAVVKRFGLDRE